MRYWSGIRLYSLGSALCLGSIWLVVLALDADIVPGDTRPIPIGNVIRIRSVVVSFDHTFLITLSENSCRLLGPCKHQS